MNKTANFFRSLVPFLFVVAIQIIASLIMLVIFAAKTMAGSGSLAEGISSLVSDQGFVQGANILYAVISLAVFGIWYYSMFVKPFQRRRRNYPSGFSFHTVVALICLAVGLQYICKLVVDLISSVNANWLTSYNELMANAGYENLSLLLILYTVVLAPITEELVFRGLIFRYARHASPFWVANIWQALLFGIIHMNIIQGVYAFTAGLFLGWVCRRGRGIKYSILMHILFNFFGTFYAGLFSMTTSLSYPLSIAAGIALTLFGVWLFYTDFLMEPE